MALTITERSRQAIGNRLRIVAKCVTGTSTAGSLTITAGSLGLNYIESAILAGGAMTSADIGDWFISTDAGTYVDMNVTSLDASDAFFIEVTGY